MKPAVGKDGSHGQRLSIMIRVRFQQSFVVRIRNHSSTRIVFLLLPLQVKHRPDTTNMHASKHAKTDSYATLSGEFTQRMKLFMTTLEQTGVDLSARCKIGYTPTV
jgi:hypothetical protein